LKALKVRYWQVKIYTDSAYIVNAFDRGWLKSWAQNGWITAGKKPVANQDLWQEIKRQTGNNRVQVIKVPGHKGVKWNERCDELARQAIKNLKR
jgi:ribonuclease HI